MTDWNSRYLDMARLVQSWSKDSTKVGAVIFNPHTHAPLCSGYNGFPRGVDEWDAARHMRPAKYLFSVHAETNAIYNAARHGITLDTMGMALDWHPCAHCAGAIIQCGITQVICPFPDTEHDRWGEEFTASAEMLEEAHIDTQYFTPIQVRP